MYLHFRPCLSVACTGKRGSASLNSQIKKDILMVFQKSFACEADAHKELERFQKVHKNNLFLCTAKFDEKKIEKSPHRNP